MRALILGLVILLIFAGTGLYFYMHSFGPVALELPPIVTSTEITPSAQAENREIPAGMKEYKTSRFHFSLLYPETFTALETISPGGSLTVTFENNNKDDLKGFQVFVIPYTQQQITPARFNQDIPSGIRKNVENIVLRGSKGVAFYSEDENLGETREVWVIDRGLLYEVTSPKALEELLRDVLLTWEFI